MQIVCSARKLPPIAANRHLGHTFRTLKSCAIQFHTQTPGSTSGGGIANSNSVEPSGVSSQYLAKYINALLQLHDAILLIIILLLEASPSSLSSIVVISRIKIVYYVTLLNG